MPDRDRQVLSLRYSRDLTQQQVSRIVGVSQVQVSRIEKRAIEKLREMLRGVKKELRLSKNFVFPTICV